MKPTNPKKPTGLGFKKTRVFLTLRCVYQWTVGFVILRIVYSFVVQLVIVTGPKGT